MGALLQALDQMQTQLRERIEELATTQMQLQERMEEDKRIADEALRVLLAFALSILHPDCSAARQTERPQDYERLPVPWPPVVADRRIIL